MTAPRVLLLCQSLDQAGGVERFACGLANHLAGQGCATAIGSVGTPADAVAYPLVPAVRLLTAAPMAPGPRRAPPMAARQENAPPMAAREQKAPPTAARRSNPAPRPASPENTSPPVARGQDVESVATAATAALGGGVRRRWRLAQAQWRTGRALAGLVRAERPDVVVLNGLTTACSVLLFCPGCAARAICCDHNHFDARSRPWRWLRAHLYPQVAAIVSLTETDAPKFRALNPRTEVIANASVLRRAEAPDDAPPDAVSPDNAAPDAVPPDTVPPDTVPPDAVPPNATLPGDAPPADASPPDPSPPPPDPPPLVLLAIGRCVAQKGFDLLLQAWRQVLRPPEVAARLRIVGDGPLREALMAESRRLGLDDTVEWLEPTADIERHYREAAVFVLPSRYEGLPLVLLEAQAMGLPAVAFDCPTGPAEIVTPETGIVVPPQDVAALADALNTLLAQPALRRRMGRAAWERSRVHFSVQAHLDRWTALIAAVAAQRAGPARHA